MSSITLTKGGFGDYDVLGWDAYNGEDDVFIGTITNPDGYYYFEVFESSPLLTCRLLMDIGYELSRLNKEKT